jgi:hypothetical protein
MRNASPGKAVSDQDYAAMVLELKCVPVKTDKGDSNSKQQIEKRKKRPTLIELGRFRICYLGWLG